MKTPPGLFAALLLATTFTTVTTLPSATAQVGKNLGLLNPNLATEAELAALPGLDAATAKSLIEGRPYLTPAALDARLPASLTKEQRQALYAKLWVPLHLNTASSAEIALIPGVGKRMIHEFEEYRPYVSLAQFHKEIGKYVDATELARLAQYVYVPIDLNTASDEDILSIPGIGKRMLHEFKEYRPYKNIEQFRREIGKYVDAQEVARLESYVVVK